MRQNVLIWLYLLSIIGLAGFRLLRKRKTSIKEFNLLNDTPYSGLKAFIIAQSKVESGNYTSPLFLRSNNAFGMKNANVRKQLGYKIFGDPYRYYNSLSESISDFILYLDYVGFPENVNTVEMYVGNLKRLNYFESAMSDYVKAMKSWL